VAPPDYTAPNEAELTLVSELTPDTAVEVAPPTRLNPEAQYRQLFNRMKLNLVDLATRRDVLRDIYRELCDHPGDHSTENLIDLLQERYEAQGVVRNKPTIRDVLQNALRQNAVDYHKRPYTIYTPLFLASGVDSEAVFVRRSESDYVYALVRSGLELDLEEAASLLLSDRNQTDYIQMLLDDLKIRGLIVKKGKAYTLPGQTIINFADKPALQILVQDLETVQIPDNLGVSVETAQALAKKAMVQRSQDFAASANTYLLACRIQWDSVEKGEPGATLEDLRWYMASYASAIAGKLSQVNHDYAGARPYYLAFFSLVQEEDPLWARMRGLINPMLSYYWANAGRELEMNVSTWNLSMSSPAQIAVTAANHTNPELRRLWQHITEELAQVNPGLLRRISHQIMLNRAEYPENARVAEQIENILASLTPA
jgi:hypothetical protein